MWRGFIWHGIKASGRLLETQWTFEFLNIQGSLWMAEQLLTSQEGP
jgi:hypothetical protein